MAEAKGRLGDQVEHALGWFRSLGRGERYDGLLRTDVPMLPEDVIREAVVNAVIHRNYAVTGSAVMFEVFSDRVDVTSPGTLPKHMTVDEARSGGTVRSRNELMATAMVAWSKEGADGCSCEAGCVNSTVRSPVLSIA